MPGLGLTTVCPRGSWMYGTRGVRASVAVVGAALLLAGCFGGDSDDKGKQEKNGPGSGISQQPKDSDPYWVNPDGNAAQQVATYEKAGKKADAELIRKIAEQPTGEWLTPENRRAGGAWLHRGRREGGPGRAARPLQHPAPRLRPVLAAAAPRTATRTGLSSTRSPRASSDRPATVILEPDAVLHMVDGCTAEEFHEERYDLLKGAIEHAQVPEEHEGLPGRGQRRLGQARRRSSSPCGGRASTRPTASRSTCRTSTPPRTPSPTARSSPRRWATSRSSSTPAATATGRTPRATPRKHWCNPPGRALGEAPTTKTADALVDAYLWVKRPGESDGECKGGPEGGGVVARVRA